MQPQHAWALPSQRCWPGGQQGRRDAGAQPYSYTEEGNFSLAPAAERPPTPCAPPGWLAGAAPPAYAAAVSTQQNRAAPSCFQAGQSARALNLANPMGPTLSMRHLPPGPSCRVGVPAPAGPAASAAPLGGVLAMLPVCSVCAEAGQSVLVTLFSGAAR